MPCAICLRTALFRLGMAICYTDSMNEDAPQLDRPETVEKILNPEETPKGRFGLTGRDILILVGFLMVLGIFVFDHIGESSLWLDEAASANTILSNFADIWGRAAIDAQSVFYIYTLKVWSVFFGDSAFALRTFSSFWALILVVLIYKITKEFFGNRVAVVASAIASTNYFLVWYATQIRVYTLITVLCLLSYYFFCKTIEGASWNQRACYMVITVFGLYAHPWFYFVLAAQILSFLLFGKWERDAIICFAAIILLAVPNIFIWTHLSSIGANSWMVEATIGNVIDSFIFFSYGSTWLYAIFTTLCIIWVASGNKPVYTGSRQYILLLHFFIPLLLAWMVSQFSPIYVAGRYEMILLPLLITLLAIVWSKIDYRLLFAVFLLLLYFTNGKVAEHRKIVESYVSDDRRVAEQIVGLAEKNDMIITTDLSWATMYYYVTRLSENKEINIRSFPKEIELHPGWKNMSAMQRNKKLYSKEADELLAQVETNTALQNVWVVNNSANEINAPLIDLFKEKFTDYELIELGTPRENSWFDELYRFKKSQANN